MLFVIVGSREPLYSLELNAQADESQQHRNQFVLHSSLDLVDRMAYTNNSCYLRAVDRGYDQTVSCFLSPGGVKFLLLHGGNSEDSIRSFFIEAHELYVKVTAC